MSASVEGLETPLFTALALLLAHQVLRSTRSWQAGVTASLLCLARPDGALFVVAALAGLILSWRADGVQPRERTKRLLAFIVPIAAVLLPYLSWRWQYYGYPLPNSFYAKMGGDELPRVKSGVLRTLSFVSEMGGIGIVGVAAFAFSSAATRRWALGVTAFAVARLVFQAYSGGEYMGHYRFLTPALPFVYLLAWGGAANLVRWIPTSRLDLSVTRALGGPAAVALAALLAWNFWMTRGLWRSHMEYARGLKSAHIALGKELGARASGRQYLACQDAGALPFYSKLPTIDMLGLNDVHIAHLEGTFYEKYDVGYVLSLRPAWIVLLSKTPRVQGFTARTPVDDATYRNAAFWDFYTFWREYRFGFDYYLWVYRTRQTRNVPAPK